MARLRTVSVLSLNLIPPPLSSSLLSLSFPATPSSPLSVALHPKKPILATCSDDKSWKMWLLPKGELIMSGDGHKDWVSSCDFSPK